MLISMAATNNLEITSEPRRDKLGDCFDSCFAIKIDTETGELLDYAQTCFNESDGLFG